MKEVDQILTGRVSQREMDALNLPEVERLKLMNRFDDHVQLWWVTSDSVPTSTAAAAIKDQLKPDPTANRYHRELAWLGRADGFSWYGYMPIYEWIHLRGKLELSDGENVVAAAARGLAIDDLGNTTANSVEGLLVRDGRAAIPYLKAAVKQPHFARAIRVLAMIDDPEATGLMMDYARSSDNDLARAARHYLIYSARPQAEDLYFQWIAADIGRVPVFRLLDTCARVNKTRLKPLLPRILAAPKSRFEFRLAFDLSRELSGPGIPSDLLRAEELIKTCGYRHSSSYDESKVNAAVEVLSQSADVEAAAHLAISLACTVSKGGAKVVNGAGITILQRLPGSLAGSLVKTLVSSCDDDKDWIRRQLQSVHSE